MDKKYIEDNEIEIKYLRNQLTDDELGAFELFLMQNPNYIDELELAELLTQYLPKTKRPNDSFYSSLVFFSQRRGRELIVATTMFMLGVISVSLFDFGAEQRGSMQAFTLNQVRSATPGSYESIVELDRDIESSGLFLLLLDVSIERTGPYQASVYKQSENGANDILFDSLYLPATNSDGYLGIDLQKSKYQEGSYEIRLINEKEDIDLKYKFKLVR